MCRRRFFKSYLYIEYGGRKYKNGETVSVSPFIAEGNSTTIVLDSARPWNITNNISWLTVSSSSNKSGTYTITLAAAANQTYGGRSGSFTAKTLDDRYSIVVSVSQQPKASENYIYVTPQQITLDAEDTYDALNCDFYHNGQSPVPVTPVWSTESDVISVSADGVVTSNNQTAQAFNNIEVWAKYIYEGNELWDSMKVNVNAASIQRFITVEPQSVSMEATGTQQLTVIYHEIINGHETTTPVTNSSEYRSDSQVITVNGTGLISANNQSEDPATATITVTYDSVQSVNVPVTANSASVEYRNLRVEPSEMSLNSSNVENGKLVHAYVDEYINGQPTGVVVEVTSAVTWKSNHTDVATVSSTGNNEVIKPVYGSGYFPDERDATITGSYLGMTDTCEVTVEPEGYVEQYLTVQPSTTSITSTGGVQLVVKLITKTDGRVTGEETVTNNVTYTESSPLINVNSTGYVSATGSETGGQAIVTIRYPGHNVEDIQATINVQGASVDEYLEITPASTSTTWNGQVTYEVFYVREVNGQKTSTKITDASVLRFDLSDGTVGEMNGFVFNAENISTAYTDEEISVTCTAGTYNGFSTRTPAELRVNGASSVAPRLDITAPKYNMASAETMQISATYVIVVNGNDYKTEALNPTAVTWDENSNYASISNASSTAGRLRSNNTTNSVQHVTATGEYNTTEFGKVTGYSSDILIARQKENITYDNLRYVTGSNVTVTSVSMAASETDNTWYYLIEDKYDNLVWIDYWDATNYCSYTLYSGNTELASIDKETSGTKYNANGLKIEFQRGSGFKFTSSNTEEKQQKFTLHASETDGGADLSITIAAAQHVPVTAYTSIFYVSGNVNTVITTLSLASAQTKNKVFVYEDEEIDGQHSRYINDTENATYTLYSGNTQLATFRCTSTGQKYSDANLTISYNGTTNGLVFESSNEDQNKVQNYTLTVTDDGLSEDLDITIARAENTTATINFGDLILNECSNLSIYDLTNMKLSAFTIFDGNGNSISSNSLTIGTLSAHEQYPVTNVGWRSSSLSTSIGQTLTARLYFYFNGGGNDINTTSAIWVGSEIYGTYNPGLSVNGYQVFDFDLGTVPSAGILNYGDVEIIFGIEGGEGDITVTCLNKLIDNTGGTSEFTVTWRDMAENGTIAIRCTGESGTVVLRHRMSPATFTGANGSGSVYVDLGENPGAGGRFYVSGSGIDFAGNNKLASDYGEQNGGYVPPVLDCNFSLSYEGQTPVPYDGNATFKLYYGDDVDTSTIGVIQRNPAIVEIDLEDVTPGEMNVIVELTSNCGDSNRTFPFTLSALCGSETVTASNSTVEQAHQIGYPVTVSNNVYALVINNTSQDIYLNGLQVYSKNDCSSANLYQFPFGNAEMIPANSQKQIMTVIGGTNRANDTQIWGEWSFSNTPLNSYTELTAGGFKITEPGIVGAADITHTVTISPGNIILQVRML